MANNPAPKTLWKKQFAILLGILTIILLWMKFDYLIFQVFLPKEVKFFRAPHVWTVREWSSDGTFLFGEWFEKSYQQVYIWQFNSGSFELVTEPEYFPLELGPVLSPNGDFLAFQSSNHDDGFLLSQLSTNKIIPTDVKENPAWSLDSQGLYYSDYGGDLIYYDLSTDQTTEIFSFSPELNILDLQLSPDGQSLILNNFSRNENDFGARLILYTLVEDHPQTVLYDSVEKLLGWSQDGEWILYHTWADQVYGFHLEEECRSQPLDFSKFHAEYAFWLTWSPTNDRIAAVGNLAGERGIFIIEPTDFLDWPSLENCTPLGEDLKPIDPSE